MASPIAIREGIHWVGALDPELRVFDIVMRTENGSSYNAYLVEGTSATALVDTVKHGFESQLLDRLAAIREPSGIDYLVVNHTEPDHSGAVGAFLEAAPDVTVIGTTRAIQFLEAQLNRAVRSRVVKAGDTLELGGRTLRFVPSPWLHWPDTMFSYLEEEQILFSGDVFGAHHADPALFDDAVANDFLDDFKYYYDVIMAPFAGHVQKGLSRIAELDIRIICPTHGPILRSSPERYIALYDEWSRARTRERPLAALCYASAHGFTAAIADAVAEGLRGGGVDVEMLDLVETGVDAAAAACLAADAVVIGSPTINGVPAPPALALLAHMDLFRSKGKPFGAFGSYGWSGEAVEMLMARAADLRMKPVGEGLRVAFAPSSEDLQLASDYGRAVAAATLGTA